MPTATSTLGWTLTNWGPLPETYTPDPTCTEATDIFIGYTNDPYVPFWVEVCSTATTDNCWPVPTEQSAIEEYVNNPYLVAYQSPAAACPSGWESVGAAANPADGPVTSSGVFAGYPGRWDYHGEEEVEINEDEPVALGWKDAIGALLDEGETAIACCPSSMSVTLNGLCYEALPTRPVSTACDGTWTTASATQTTVSTTYMLNGTTASGNVVIPATNSVYALPIASTTTTFAPEETGDLVAVRMQGPLVLVHRDGDVDSTESVEEGEDDIDSDGSEETEDEVSNSTETNAAMARLYTAGRGGNEGWGMLGFLGAATLLGVGLVLHA
ncbi:hypothetical protein BJY00DRAFT_1927 [Aspergillus carlsbadensis]|nr:hypothetical protein BJY00DRAFT_1927 [Aspergillus carlsbadensis]